MSIIYVDVKKIVYKLISNNREMNVFNQFKNLTSTPRNRVT